MKKATDSKKKLEDEKKTVYTRIEKINKFYIAE
jgi:hypothetical protein